MRVAPCVVLAILMLISAGCSTFGKKSAGSAHPKAPAADQGPGPQAERSPPPPSFDRTSPPLGVNGVLAGQIIDNNNRRPASAFIQVAELDETASARGAPIEVRADPQGYFTIQGLQTGRRYQLTARVRNGSQVLAGTVLATPPDPKLVIRVSQPPSASAELGPPRAQTPVASGPNAPPPPSWPEPQAAVADQAWGPTRTPSTNPRLGAPTPGSGRAAELRPPVEINDGPSRQTPPVSAPPGTPAPRLENIVGEDERDYGQQPSNIKPQVPQNPRGAPPSPPNGPPRPQFAPLPPLDVGPARVPSCVLTGQTLHNFALNDLNGRPWEFRNHRGRLVLVDFWGPWCVPCLQAIPHLNILQERYGPSGLEVVGIAYDKGQPLEQARKVNDVRQRLRINYRLLLGGDPADCPVRQQFRVTNWPTLVLLDERGRIVWRGEGLDAQHLNELDIVIRQRLTARQ